MTARNIAPQGIELLKHAETKAYSDLSDLLSQKYSNISTVVDDGKLGYLVELTVGVQGFCITRYPLETQEEAEWMQKMLGKALEQIVLNEELIRLTEPLLSDDLSCWFGLSYASFCVLPRVLMEDMPNEWQNQMAKLLNEYSDAFPNQPDIGARVQITKGKKLIKTPDWIINYRHPDREAIDALKG